MDRQLPIFEDELDPTMEPSATDTVTIAAHSRKNRGRKPLPRHLPRVEIVHVIDEEDKVCTCGQRLSRIGEDTCEKLDYIPAKVRVEHHIRPKYACKACEGVEVGIVHLGCMAHVRRKFHDVVKVRKKQRGKRAKSKGLADQVLDYIGRLYRIEKQIRQEELSFEQIYQRRQQQSKPVLEQFKKWLDATQSLTPPKGLLGRAISYALKNWPKLTCRGPCKFSSCIIIISIFQ